MVLDFLWKYLPIGYVKGNFDGMDVWTPSLATCGGIFRNSMSGHISSFSNFIGKGNAISSKFIGDMVVVEFTSQNNCSHFWLKSDCLLVVQALSHLNLVPWKLKARRLDFINLTHSMHFIVSHTFRKGNVCASKLANIRFTHRNFLWFDYIHDTIKVDFLRNLKGIPCYRYKS